MRHVPIVMTAAIAVTLPASAADARLRWTPPVPGAPVRHFDLGPNPFARGQHRGVDLAAAGGEAVRSACAGRVVFAGSVAGVGTVSVRCGRWRVSYAPLATPPAVKSGNHVRRGARLGRVAAGHHAGRVRRGARLGRVAAGHHASRTGRAGQVAGGPHGPGLHFGVRREGRRFGYVDPLGFLARAAPAPPPVTPRPPPAPRRLRPRGPPPAAAPAPAPWPVWLGLGLLLTGLVGAGTVRSVRAERGHTWGASSISSSSPTIQNGR